MRLQLYYLEEDVMDVPENRGFDPLKINSLLRQLKEEREIDYTIISHPSPAELDRAYQAAIICSSWNRYPIRKVFGTNKSSGSFFGRGVPALLAYEGERPVQVIPHEGPQGEPTTIRDYLENLLTGDGGGEALARRMDKLRRIIGPIGAPTSELVREGRRR